MKFSKTARGAIAQVSMDACSLHKSIMLKVQFECCSTIKAGQTRIHDRKVWAGCIVKLNTYELRNERCAFAQTSDSAKYCYHVMKFSKTAREAIAQVSMDACSLHKSIMFQVRFRMLWYNQRWTNSHSPQKSVSGLYSKWIRTSWETKDVRTRRRPIQPNVRGVWSSSARQHAKRSHK